MGLRKVLRRDRGEKKRDKVGLLVPGQGFQRPGMGRGEDGNPIEFLEAVINDAKEIIDPIQVERIRYLMLVDASLLSPKEKSGLEKEIDRTDNAQVALFLLTVASWKKYQADENNPMPSVVLGHSAGETAAAHIVGALDLGNGLKYALSRGAYMNIANTLFQGGMIRVRPQPEEEIKIKTLEELLKDTKVEIANINTPKQVVLSGSLKQLEWVSEKLRAEGFRVNFLRGVAGAYHHSIAMASVKKALDELLSLSLIIVREPAIKWILNFSGAPEDDVKKLKISLPAQTINTVMWRKSIETALGLGITKLEELGPGQGLTKMLEDFPAWQKMEEKLRAAVTT